jgi:membrane dipeptidase
MTSPAGGHAPAAGYGSFDFGLTAEQEERARTLHDASIVIDLQWQGPCSPDVWTSELEAELDQAADRDDFTAAYQFLANRAADGRFPAYRELYKASGASAGWVECTLSDERQLLADAYFAARLLNRLPWARRTRTAAQVRAAKSADQIAFLGICAFNQIRPGELHLIDVAHELGLLDVVELAYNQMNFVGTGCTERYDAGLSGFGLEFVRRCNATGVIIDTAHTGHQTTLDACQESAKPVVATHTSAAALYPHDRAKSDEELRAIAATGGVIGVYAIPFYLGPPGQQAPTIELMLDHIDYIAQLTGWQHLGIGPDWPIALPEAVNRRLLVPTLESHGFRAEHGVADVTSTLDGFRDPRDLVNITRGLVARGYRDEQIRGILGENFLRVFAEVCG